MLPGEDEFSRRMSRELQRDLMFGHAFLDTCVSILTERHPTKPPAPDNIVSYRVGHALCVKACKTYRSALLLAQIGASHDMHILGRTLFENAMAVVFVLRPGVQLSIKGFPDDQLTPEVRARVYANFEPIRQYQDFLRLKNDSRFDMVTSKVNADRLRDNAAHAETEAGSFWADRMKKRPYTYSGLTLRELAAKLDPDLSRLYASVYGLQSKPVHAVDASQHVRMDDGRMIAKWHTSPQDVRGVLVFAGAILCHSISELNRRFEFEANPHDGTATSLEIQMAIKVLETMEGAFKPESTTQEDDDVG